MNTDFSAELLIKLMAKIGVGGLMLACIFASAASGEELDHVEVTQPQPNSATSINQIEAPQTTKQEPPSGVNIETTTATATTALSTSTTAVTVEEQLEKSVIESASTDVMPAEEKDMFDEVVTENKAETVGNESVQMETSDQIEFLPSIISGQIGHGKILNKDNADATKSVAINTETQFYTVRLGSKDSTHKTGFGENQTQEQWKLEALNADGEILFTTDPTMDLEDAETSRVDDVGVYDFTGATFIRGRHARQGTSIDSIEPGSFDLFPVYCDTDCPETDAVDKKDFTAVPPSAFETIEETIQDGPALQVKGVSASKQNVENTQLFQNFTSSVEPIYIKNSAGLNVTVLGDSYAAGTGAGDYNEYRQPGKNSDFEVEDDIGICWRSDNSWGEKYSKYLQGLGYSVRFINRACNGAVIDNIGAPEEVTIDDKTLRCGSLEQFGEISLCNGKTKKIEAKEWQCRLADQPDYDRNYKSTVTFLGEISECDGIVVAPQIESLTGEEDLILMMVGGNDAGEDGGLSDLVKACFIGATESGNACENKIEYAQNQLDPKIKYNLVSKLTEVAKTSSDAKIGLIQYPYLTKANYKLQPGNTVLCKAAEAGIVGFLLDSCEDTLPVGEKFRSFQDQATLKQEEAVAQVNKALGTDRVFYIDGITEKFAGKEPNNYNLDQNDARYINEPLDVGFKPYLQLGGPRVNEVHHPNQKGTTAIKDVLVEENIIEAPSPQPTRLSQDFTIKTECPIEKTFFTEFALNEKECSETVERCLSHDFKEVDKASSMFAGIEDCQEGNPSQKWQIYSDLTVRSLNGKNCLTKNRLNFATVFGCSTNIEKAAKLQSADEKTKVTLGSECLEIEGPKDFFARFRRCLRNYIPLTGGPIDEVTTLGEPKWQITQDTELAPATTLKPLVVEQTLAPATTLKPLVVEQTLAPATTLKPAVE